MRHQQSRKLFFLSYTALTLLLVATAARAAAPPQLILQRDSQANLEEEIKGPIDLTVVPGIDDARVTVSIDGQKLTDGLRSPWHIPVDFGPMPVQHKIVITATGAGRQRVQWQTTINKGHQTLGVKIEPVDVANRIFQVNATAPDEDPIAEVSVWDGGRAVVTVNAPPYRFTIPEEAFAEKTVQVTAKTKSGAEAADFWSAAGDVKSESLDVRTVPLFVSVVDNNGTALDDVDRALFKIVDNGTEAKILQIGKAFDQPISIALLLDASTSMLYEMPEAARAAARFVEGTLKPGDRCAVFSIRSTPRREVALTGDLSVVGNAVTTLKASGQTALYDAISSAERELHDEKNRRAIVILTDGGDTSSINSFDEIDSLAKEAGVPIYVIAYRSGDPDEDPHEINRLQYLAGETGGFLVTASAQNLQAKYTDIEKDLRAQYAIVYQISDLAKHNQWRKVNVMLKSPTLTARTIRGYFAP
ncbi:MAG TPA: VWA domain-containing protein [Thermoanaerobaculia bacterium]|jgi:VWFA-related protein|nr:VWA domain-containing protein [Thermoanaerobaculia bacterium]